MTSINSRPSPSTSPISSTNALAQTSPGITAASLPALLDRLGIKPESISNGTPTYKLDSSEVETIFKDPAVKNDPASFVKAMMDSSGPIIEMEPDAAAIVAWHLGRQAALPGLNGDSNVPLQAFTELIKPFADQKHGEHYQGQMQDFYDAGKGLADIPEFGWPGGR